MPTTGTNGCSDATSDKLLYNTSTNTWSCGTDQGAGGGEANTISSQGGATALTAATPKSGVDLRVVSANATRFSVATDVLDIASVAGITGANEDDLSDDLITALSGVSTVTDGQFCQGGAGSSMDCDVAGALADDDLSDDLIAALSGITGNFADDEILVGTGVDTAGLTATIKNCNDTTEKLDWDGSDFSCITDQTGGGGLPVTDTTSIAEGSADDTKEVRFEVDGNNTGIVGVLATSFTTAKTITFPDNAGTVVTSASTTGGSALTDVDTIVLVDEAADTTNYPIFANDATGAQAPKTDTALNYNASTGQLVASSFSGSGSNLTDVVGLGADAVNAMSEIAAGIKRGPDATDTHILTTDVSAPGTATCLEMDTDGSVILAAGACTAGGGISTLNTLTASTQTFSSTGGVVEVSSVTADHDFTIDVTPGTGNPTLEVSDDALQVKYGSDFTEDANGLAFATAHTADQVGTVNDGDFCQGGAASVLDCDVSGALSDDDLSDDLITALSGVGTITDTNYCQGGAGSSMDCDVATIPAADIGNGLTNTQVDNDLTIAGGTIGTSVIEVEVLADDDTCTGQQGHIWRDSTDGNDLEYCPLDSGVPYSMAGKNSSNVWTSTQNFGGATDIEIENGTGLTLGTNGGEIGIDTTSGVDGNQLRYYSNAVQVITPVHTKCVTLEDPVGATDIDIPWFVAPQAVTVVASGCHIDAGSATVSIEDGSDNTTDSPSCSTGASVTWDESITASALTDGEVVELDIDTASGVGWATVCMKYTVDAS
jgi:hypothetical protein